MRKNLAFGLLLSAVSLSAHHSISGAYFTDQTVKIEGTVTEFNYRNPHCFLELDGKDPKTGAATHFGVEWASEKRLEREGVLKETLKPGDHLVLLGNPARKAGDMTLHMVGAIRKADGWKWGRAVE